MDFNTIVKALESEPIKQQIDQWKEQREVLRQTLKEYWEEEDPAGAKFKQWWAFVKEDVREAMVLTALEDLPNQIGFAALLTVVTPEIESVDNLLSEKAITVLQLMEVLVKADENLPSPAFSFDTFAEAFNEEATKNTKAYNHALDTLKIARSCILLQFVIGILLIYINQKDELQFH